MIRCLKFRVYEKNTLKGFADLKLARTGIIIHDCPLHEKNGREWIGFPARSYETKTGETAWQPMVEFAEDASEARRQFQEQAVEAHPRLCRRTRRGGVMSNRARQWAH